MTTKIVITGAHGVGKTSLAQSVFEAIRERHKASLIPETARLLVQKGYEVNDKINEDGVVAYLDIYLENNRRSRCEIVISDRSIFDLYLYVHELRSVKLKKTYVDLVEELVFSEIGSVDAYMYVPIEFEMTADNVRPADIQYQRKIDNDVKKLLKYFGAKNYTISGSLENRKSLILDKIDEIRTS